jgi:hypothetical protein
MAPVDILCTGDISVRTKLVRSASPDTAAVCVSEAVSHEVLRLLGLRVADGHAVTIAPDFAGDLTRQYAFEPAVSAGRHWGTTVMTAMEVEFSRDDVKLLREPSQLMTLYIGDVLLANPDRLTHGNVLLHQTENPRLFDLLPIDQSDCFNHPPDLRSPDRLLAIRGQKVAGWLPGTEDVVLDRAPGFTAAEVARIQALREPIREAVHSAPDEWYDRAGVDPASVRDFLTWRVDHLAEPIDIPFWEGLRNAIGGGHVIQL